MFHRNMNVSVLDLVRPIEGWLSDHEALLLFHIARRVRSPGEIVEIGSWKGKSTVALGKGAQLSGQSGLVWAIDPHKGKLQNFTQIFPQTYKRFKANIHTAHLEDSVRPLVKESMPAAKAWQKPVRILFIDGIHDFENSKKDYLAWQKFVSPGGVIAFHDGFCGELGVWKAIDTYFLRADTLTDIGAVGSILYGIYGKPDFTQRIIVIFKIYIIRLAQQVYRSNVNQMIKMIFIHKFLRIVLIHPYTLSVYL